MALPHAAVPLLRPGHRRRSSSTAAVPLPSRSTFPLSVRRRSPALVRSGSCCARGEEEIAAEVQQSREV